MTPELVEEERVTHALRSVRRTSFRVSRSPAGVGLTLVMGASAAGRRNAAAMIVELLKADGLTVAASDPVGALAMSRDAVTIKTGLVSTPAG
jgi:hypothetical protein